MDVDVRQKKAKKVLALKERREEEADFEWIFGGGGGGGDGMCVQCNPITRTAGDKFNMIANKGGWSVYLRRKPRRASYSTGIGVQYKDKLEKRFTYTITVGLPFQATLHEQGLDIRAGRACHVLLPYRINENPTTNETHNNS